MTIASCLLLYGVAVAVLGPRLLVRLTRAGVAPRLGVVTWLAAIGTVVASWMAAAAFLVAEAVREWDGQGGTVIAACFATLRDVAGGRLGVVLQVGLLALAALVAGALAVLAARLGRSLVRARAATYAHARMARLVGRHVDGLDVTAFDVVVLDAPERAAYCVAGHPHTIVVTSAAVDTLDQRHLGAVLAHERAHLAGRHHLLLAFTRGLALLLPRIELFTIGATEIARLLEMCADDAAARAHGTRTLLGALLALSSASVPSGALGATGACVLARAERLAVPPRRGRRLWARLVLPAVAVLVVAGPVLTAMLAAIGLCGPAV